MLADADLAAVGRTIGDTHRARFVLALLSGQELPAGELAARAGASSSLASAHLAKLLESGLITVRKRGRQRYYRLASQDIAQAIEALLAIAPRQTATGLTGVSRGKALQRARTCYDHLAGRLGVALADAFEQQRVITPADSGWVLTSAGVRRLGSLGLDVDARTAAAARCRGLAWTGQNADRTWPGRSGRPWRAVSSIWAGSAAPPPRALS